MSTFKKKESILNFEKSLDKKVYVKFTGGREIIGVLKGYDSTVNLVLDDCIEYMRDPADHSIRFINEKGTDHSRYLGIVVCRGTNVVFLAPVDGMDNVVQNPYLDQE